MEFLTSTEKILIEHDGVMYRFHTPEELVTWCAVNKVDPGVLKITWEYDDAED